MMTALFLLKFLLVEVLALLSSLLYWGRADSYEPSSSTPEATSIPIVHVHLQTDLPYLFSSIVLGSHVGDSVSVRACEDVREAYMYSTSPQIFRDASEESYNTVKDQVLFWANLHLEKHVLCTWNSRWRWRWCWFSTLLSLFCNVVLSSCTQVYIANFALSKTQKRGRIQCGVQSKCVHKLDEVFLFRCNWKRSMSSRLN